MLMKSENLNLRKPVVHKNKIKNKVFIRKNALEPIREDSEENE